MPEIKESNLTFKEYSNLASRTANPHESAMVNYALGLSGESGEVSDIIKKALYHGHELNVEHLEKELGDLLWYVAMLARELGISLDEVATKNIEKLKKRYPEGFSKEASINRPEGY